MRQWKKTAVILLVIILAFCYAHVAKSDMIYDKQTESSDYIVVELSNNPLIQEFVCEQKELDAISIKCQTIGNVENINVRMTLTDCGTHTIVANSELKGTEIKNGKFNNFPFGKIENSNGKCYQLTLESSGAENGSIGIYAQNNKEAMLIMKTVRNGFDMETFTVLLIMLLYIGAFFKFLCKLFSR